MVVAVPAGTRLRAVALAAALLLSTCGGPTPSATPVAETCTDLATAQARGLSWSQTGRYLGIGTIGPDGSTSARVIDSEGRSVGDPVHGRDWLLPESVVVTPDGRPSWLERRAGATLLVEDRAEGIVETPLPDGVDGLGWTAIGFALLQHPADGGTRILNLDVDRPGAPTVSYETELFAERLWISADPESKVLTIGHPDHHDAPSSFQVVLSVVEHHLEPEGADASGASMPALRRWVVYHSVATSRMTAVKVADPGTTVVLRDRAAQRGMVSDRGILAYVPEDPYGVVCLVDVASSLP
jgi:hypothetical protein